MNASDILQTVDTMIANAIEKHIIDRHSPAAAPQMAGRAIAEDVIPGQLADILTRVHRLAEIADGTERAAVLLPEDGSDAVAVQWVELGALANAYLMEHARVAKYARDLDSAREAERGALERVTLLDKALGEAYAKLNRVPQLLKEAEQAPTPAAPCAKSAGLDLQAMDDMATLLSSKASAYEEDREVEVTDHIMDLRSASEMISMAASALASTKAEGEASALDAMVDRFLTWPLPQSVCSDLCVTDRSYAYPRSGTSLLTADEARQMLEHVVGAGMRAVASTKAEGPREELELAQEKLARISVLAGSSTPAPQAWREIREVLAGALVTQAGSGE